MKQAKIMLGIVAVVAVTSGVLAFRAKSNQIYLYKKSGTSCVAFTTAPLQTSAAGSVEASAFTTLTPITTITETTSPALCTSTFTVVANPE